MTAPHDKLAGIKPGDRVRVSWEGVIENGYEGPNAHLTFTPDDIASDAFQIERIEPPLNVGDRVRMSDGVEGELLAISGDLGWVKHDGGSHLTWDIGGMERIA